MRKFYSIIIILVIISCYCVCLSTMILADDDIDNYYVFAKTILLEQDEEYIQERSDIYDLQSKYCRCTIIDSSLSIVDTLYGVALYWLYFDTTNVASSKELLHTKDSLRRISRLNRVVKAYSSEEIATAPPEIIVTDSLLRRLVARKRILMERYSPYYIPYHPLFVEFTIVPLIEKSKVKN